jgi:hypothetical protein
MIKIIKYNISIFRFWIRFIFFKKPIKPEAIEFLQKHYKATNREQKLINKIKKLNKIKK